MGSVGAYSQIAGKLRASPCCPVCPLACSYTKIRAFCSDVSKSEAATLLKPSERGPLVVSDISEHGSKAQQIWSSESSSVVCPIKKQKTGEKSVRQIPHPRRFLNGLVFSLQSLRALHTTQSLLMGVIPRSTSLGTCNRVMKEEQDSTIEIRYLQKADGLPRQLSCHLEFT